MIGFYAAGAMGQGGGGGGSFPAYLSATGTGFNTAATAHQVAMPATVSAGDLLIVQFASSAAATVTVPSGWTSIANVNNASIVISRVVYKIAAGTEGGTTVNFVTSFNNKATAIVHRIQAGTFDAATAPAIANMNGTSATPNPPSLSPSWGSADTLWLAAFNARDNFPISAYPYADGNTSQRSDPSNTGTSNAQSASCWTQENASSLDPGTFTRSQSDSWIAHIIAIKPP